MCDRFAGRLRLLPIIIATVNISKNNLHSLNFITVDNQDRIVEIITGRGNLSMNNKPVLKPLVESYIHEYHGYR